ncbi:hypothetical protein QUA00_09075, partial [Microcoleus sp. T2B6]
MKRNFFYWRLILSVSILPVLAIVPSLVWNQPARAQEGERAGLIHASRARQGIHSLADSESRLKLTSCTILKNRQDACSTKSEFSCGTGILPVAKQVIENGAI